MIFNPLKVFVPLGLTFGFLGILKMVYDIWALFARNPGAGWILLLQPVLSTSALLLLFVGLQFMMIGMVADGVVRRIAQHSRPFDPLSSQMSIESDFSHPLSEPDYAQRGQTNIL